MKRFLPFLFALVAPVVPGHCQTFLFTGLNAPIPDDDPSGLVDQRSVSGATADFGKVEVTLTLNSATSAGFNGDLYASLSHDGTLAVLLNRPGKDAALPLGYGDNGLALTFDDSGGYSDVHTYRLTLPGPFPSTGGVGGIVSSDGRKVDPDVVGTGSPRTTALTDFLGADPNGTWTLFLADMASGGTLELQSWSLQFQPIPEPAMIGGVMAAGLLAWASIRRRRSL